jgi:succinyl-CoA synthetase alpha subunit
MTSIKIIVFEIGKPVIVYVVAIDSSTGARSGASLAVLSVLNPSGFGTAGVLNAVQQALQHQSSSLGQNQHIAVMPS